MQLFTQLLFIAPLCKSALAYPYGAGSCAAGNNAIGGSHLSRSIVTGSLDQGGFFVSLGGAKLVAGSTSSFTINTDTPLTITGTLKTYRGFIARLGGTGGVSTVTALSGGSSSDIQVAFPCTGGEGVGGVTHTNNNDKSAITATLNLGAAASGMPLDVTVVVRNNRGVSEYYFSSFTLNAVSKLAVPTKQPVMPTKAPVIKSPVRSSPTKTPTKAVVRTNAPTRAKAPVRTNAPTRAKAPVKTNAPARPKAQ